MGNGSVENFHRLKELKRNDWIFGSRGDPKWEENFMLLHLPVETNLFFADCVFTFATPKDTIKGYVFMWEIVV